MKNIIDPAVLIMKNVAEVDVDSYVEDKGAVPRILNQGPSSRIHQKKQKTSPSSFLELPKMMKMNVRASTFERFMIAKKAYMFQTHKNVTAGEYLDHLLDIAEEK